jgi:hypothetical protein
MENSWSTALILPAETSVLDRTGFGAAWCAVDIFLGTFRSPQGTAHETGSEVHGPPG